MFLWPDKAECAFAIRDDDISYFTEWKKLEIIYNEAWERAFKVSFAVIPMHKAVNNLNVPPEFRGKLKYYPIYENKALCEYLKLKMSEKKADIIQHGFCHTENTNNPDLKFDLEKGTICTINGQNLNLAKISEFYGLSEVECLKRIRKGRKILEQTFGNKVLVFASPQEYLSKSLFRALWREKLCYCGGANVHAIPIRNVRFFPLILNALRKLLRKKAFPQDICDISDIPHLIPIYRHYWNKYVNDKLSRYWFNQFKEEFNLRLKRKGFFILVTHHWEYFYDWQNEVTQKKQLEYFNKILEYVDNYNVWKCSITELFKWLLSTKQLNL